MKKSFLSLALLLAFSFLFTNRLQAQRTGLINRTATSIAGRAVLDPNGDGYTSATTAGFGTDDVANSELAYKAIRAFSVEPFGDLRRGPNHQFSDFVPDAANNGVYSYFDGSNLLFRFRMGSVMAGSKGYSVLVDTDGKFGATGANADPNYQAATTGTNGNPGFEIEIVLETNFRIAVYNVDGTSNPTLVTQYTAWQDYSQVSIAGTNDNGDPDFYMDFYVPFSALTGAPFNLTTASPLRMSATTVMAPKAAIGGPKSDIYGLNDNNYKSPIDQWEAYINAQPPVSPTNLGGGGSGMGGMCTAAPTVNSPVGVGTVSVSGTWTASSLSGAATTATVTVYRNGTAIGTVAGVTSGSTWTLNSVSAAAGDVFTARAQATGESLCLLSNAVTATSCNASNRPAQATGFCGDRKGFEATNYPAGSTINLYRLMSSGSTLIASGLRGASGFTANGAGWTLSGGCSTGGGSYDGGTYMVTYTLGGCESVPAFACATNTQAGWNTVATTDPVISTTVYTSTTTLNGTAVAGATLRLYVDGIFVGNPTLTGTNWSYSLPAPLRLGQSVTVTAQLADNVAGKIYYCVGSTSTSVLCFTAPPLINVDAANRTAAGAPLTGTSGEPAGTLVRVYANGGTTPVATTPVQANGTWSTGNAGTTPATLNTVAGTSYQVTAQNGACGQSLLSAAATAATATANTRCGSINVPAVNATVVTGTVTGSVANTTVNLYLDGELIGSTTTGTTAWSVTVNSTATNALYANGVLTIGLAESGSREVLCSATATIGCSPSPTSPTIVSPTNPTIGPNQSITYTLSGINSGAFYGIADGTTGQALATGIWATSTANLNITTYPLYASNGTYNIVVKSTLVSGVTVCNAVPAAASITVSNTLPVTFLSVTAARAGNNEVNVGWTVSNEDRVAYYVVERSTNCNRFAEVGRVPYRTAGGGQNQYGFADGTAPAGRLCYRIRQVDVDGRVQYSRVVALQGATGASLLVMPNPASSTTTVQLTTATEGPVTLLLVDGRGQTVLQQTHRLPRGTTALRLDGLQRFAKGNYVLKAIGPDGVSHQKLILQ